MVRLVGFPTHRILDADQHKDIRINLEMSIKALENILDPTGTSLHLRRWSFFKKKRFMQHRAVLILVRDQIKVANFGLSNAEGVDVPKPKVMKDDIGEDPR